MSLSPFTPILLPRILTTVVTAALALATFSPSLSQAQVCAELFRSTPRLEALITKSVNAPKAFVPSESQLLTAAYKDALGLDSWSATAKHTLRNWFSILRFNASAREEQNVEFHLRHYERDLAELGITPRKDLRAQLRKHRVFLSTTLAVGLNTGVNYLAYHYLNAGPFLVYFPIVDTFKPRTIPDEVLNELIDAHDSKSPTPKTRAYVSSRIRIGVDLVVETGRRFYHAGLLSVALAAQAHMILHPVDPAQHVKAMAGGIHDLAIETNNKTLKELAEKRKRFIAEGNLEKVARADALILEIEKHNQNLRNPPEETPEMLSEPK